MWSTAERATAISPSPPSIPRLHQRPAESPGPRGSSGPRGSPRTLLDGGWWPRSADPVAELPGLILALQANANAGVGVGDHGPITHVLLPAADWDSHPRRLLVDGPSHTQVVRLSWFDTMPTGLLTAIWADGLRIDLLTVPASTQQVEARAAMELAAHPANCLRTPDLLAALSAPDGPVERVETEAAPESTRETPQSAETPESTWESEGGRLRVLVATP